MLILLSLALAAEDGVTFNNGAHKGTCKNLIGCWFKRDNATAVHSPHNASWPSLVGTYQPADYDGCVGSPAHRWFGYCKHVGCKYGTRSEGVCPTDCGRDDLPWVRHEIKCRCATQDAAEKGNAELKDILTLGGNVFGGLGVLWPLVGYLIVRMWRRFTINYARNLRMQDRREMELRVPANKGPGDVMEVYNPFVDDVKAMLKVEVPLGVGPGRYFKVVCPVGGGAGALDDVETGNAAGFSGANPMRETRERKSFAEDQQQVMVASNRATDDEGNSLPSSSSGGGGGDGGGGGSSIGMQHKVQRDGSWKASVIVRGIAPDDPNSLENEVRAPVPKSCLPHNRREACCCFFPSLCFIVVGVACLYLGHVHVKLDAFWYGCNGDNPTPKIMSVSTYKDLW
jgi:hypothetical protein